jgi:predicted RNA-binding Zn-ribbon protein involved in translation (DUF1610 family)
MVRKSPGQPVQTSLDQYGKDLVCPYCGESFSSRYRRDKHMYACPKTPISVYLERLMNRVINSIHNVMKEVEKVGEEMGEHIRKNNGVLDDRVRESFFNRLTWVYKWYYDNKRRLNALLSDPSIMDIIRNDDNLMKKLDEVIVALNEFDEWDKKRAEKTIEAIKGFIELDKKMEPIIKKLEAAISQQEMEEKGLEYIA